MPAPSKKKNLIRKRENICRKYDLGRSIKEISEDLESNYRTTASVIRLYVKTGRVQSKKRRCTRAKKITTEGKYLIQRCINEDVSVSLKKIKAKLSEDLSISVSRTTINKELKQLHYTFKRVSVIPETRNSVRCIEERYNYFNEYLLFDEND